MSWSVCVTNPKRYEELLRSFPAEHSHFPQAIPSSATRVVLSFGPRFLRSSTHLQLRVKLPPEEVQAILAKHRQEALSVLPAAQAAEFPAPLTRFYTGDIQGGLEASSEAFPDGYLILCLGPYSPREAKELVDNLGKPGHEYDMPFNNGESYGLAIDVSASEVIYWAEAW